MTEHAEFMRKAIGKRETGWRIPMYEGLAPGPIDFGKVHLDPETLIWLARWMYSDDVEWWLKEQKYKAYNEYKWNHTKLFEGSWLKGPGREGVLRDMFLAGYQEAYYDMMHLLQEQYTQALEEKKEMRNGKEDEDDEGTEQPAEEEGVQRDI